MRRTTYHTLGEQLDRYLKEEGMPINPRDAATAASRELYKKYKSSLNYLKKKEPEDEEISEFNKFKSLSNLNLESLEKGKIYYISFSDATGTKIEKDATGKLKKIPFPKIKGRTILDIPAELIEIQTDKNELLEQSRSEWILFPGDNNELNGVIISVNNSKLRVRDTHSQAALIKSLGKSILRQKKGYVIPREMELIISDYLKRNSAQEFADLLKKNEEEKMTRLFGPERGGRKTKSRVRKTKCHQKKSRKTKKHYRK